MKKTVPLLVALSLTLAGCSAPTAEVTSNRNTADRSITDRSVPDRGVTTETTPAEDPEQFLAAHGLTIHDPTTPDLVSMDASSIIEHLDTLPVPQRPTDLIASVRINELVLSDDSQEITLDLPDNQTYVSIAPYVTQTHDCFYHSLTTCLGELSNEPVHVTITDETSGEILVDEQATTFDNGFIGFWLPLETTGTIEITHRDQTGTTGFSTTGTGATCVTDLQLT